MKRASWRRLPSPHYSGSQRLWSIDKVLERGSVQIGPSQDMLATKLLVVMKKQSNILYIPLITQVHRYVATIDMIKAQWQ